MPRELQADVLSSRGSESVKLQHHFGLGSDDGDYFFSPAKKKGLVLFFFLSRLHSAMRAKAIATSVS